MSYLHLSPARIRSLVADSIVLLFVVGYILGVIPSTWGVPVLEIDPRMNVKPPPPTLEELSHALQKGQYREVLQRGRELLAKNPETPVYGLFSVAFAGLEQFDNASKALEKAKADGEPNYQLFAHMGQAMIYHSQKQYDKAISACGKAIQHNAKNPLAYLTLGLVHFGKQDYEQSEKDLKQAIALEPELAHGHTALGANYLVQKKVREAFASYRKATEIEPRDARPHIGLATIYSGMRMFHQAINEYETVLRLNPSYHQAHDRLSSLYLQVGRYDDAIDAARAVLQKDSQSTEAHSIMARAHSSQNRFDEAIDHLNQVVSLQPDSIAAYYLLGLSWMAKGDFQAAKQNFQKAEQIDALQSDTAIALGVIEHIEGNYKQAIAHLERARPTPSDTIERFVHLLLANVYLSQREWAKAAEHLQKSSGFIFRFNGGEFDLREHFKKASAGSLAQANLATLFLLKGWQDKGIAACDLALKRHKSNLIAMYIKGKALAQKRALDQAIAQFQQVNRLASQFASVHYELAELYVAQKSPKQAISEYQKVIELNPDDPTVYLRLGAIYEIDGKNQDAVNAYKQVMALSPDSAIGYNQLAYHYGEKEQNLGEALSLAQKAVQLAPKNGAILDTLGWVHFRRGDYKEAVEQLKRASQGMPYSSTIRFHLGMAYFKSEDPQSALSEFRNALRISQQFPESDETRTMIQQIEAQ